MDLPHGRSSRLVVPLHARFGHAVLFGSRRRISRHCVGEDSDAVAREVLSSCATVRPSSGVQCSSVSTHNFEDTVSEMTP